MTSTCPRPNPTAAPFLTGEWRHLLMLNYEIDPEILKPLVPSGTELDFWDDKAICSMVGFRFLNTRVRKIGFPFHQNFDEVNLRFYVRRLHEGEWRRAVVFVREVVPRTAIAAIARLAYNEPYLAMPMRHTVQMEAAVNGGEGLVRYQWRGKRWYTLEATTSGAPQTLEPGSEAEFITEHYWGYTSQRDGGCLQYQVEHPRWRVWPAKTARFDCDIDRMYGHQFTEALQAAPRSAFVAEGSDVAVYHGVRI